MAERTALLWRLLPAVRRHERERFAFFFALSIILAFAQTLGLAGSEALFLSQVGPGSLPQVFVLASLVTLMGCLGYAGVVGQARNDSLYVALLAGSGVLLVIAYGLLGSGTTWVLYALFCAAYLTQAVLISLHYWTFAADFFDTLQSKRLFPYLGVGASAGGVVGGITTAVLSASGSANSLMIAWAGTLVVSGIGIRHQRINLKRWRQVGSDEKDETSVAGLGSALRYLTRSPLARCLVVSMVAMIFSLFLIQFIYLGIFSRSFASAETLAAFLGVYLAVSNAFEIFTGNVVTPWLLRRFGVARSNLLHPFLTLITFALLALDPRLYIAILARMDADMLENALAAQIRQLSYNALPFRFRGRMRALLEGVVRYGAMAIAGLALIAGGGAVSLPWLCLLGGSTSILYLAASLLVRREYLRSLVTELRRGRLDLEDLNETIGHTVLAGLAEQWESLLDEDREYPSPALLQLAGMLARGGFADIVVRAVSHPHPRVRTACIESLSEVSYPGLAEIVKNALDDEDTGVRLAAAQAVTQIETLQEDLRQALEQKLGDSDPAVRAEVALRLEDGGHAVLAELASSSSPDATVAALQRLPVAMLDHAINRMGDPDPQVRATALTAVAKLTDATSLPLGKLLDALEDRDAPVREAAAWALGSREEPQVPMVLARVLDDHNRQVRAAAAQGLARLGEKGVFAASTVLTSTRIWTVDAALSAIAESREGDLMRHLGPAYRECVNAAWQLRAGMEIGPQDESVRSRFLQLALENAYLRSVWTAFRVLGFLEDQAVVRSVRHSLRSGSPRDRADALEVLCNLGDREISQQFALLLEVGEFEDKLAAASAFLSPPHSIGDVVQAGSNAEDRWLGLAASALQSGRDATETREDVEDPESIAAREASLHSSLNIEEPIMERLLALRNVPLFAQLSLDRLEAIHQLMGEAEYIPGEFIVREGETGKELYVLLEGEVEIFKSHGTANERLLTTLTPVGYFGEIAILDNAPRSATVIASKDSRLLTLAGEPFKELVMQTPEISFEIFRVLTGRIRAAEVRRD